MPPLLFDVVLTDHHHFNMGGFFRYKLFNLTGIAGGLLISSTSFPKSIA